ncbi:MAG: hypothetical protein R2932_59070 [Caldilineaceae bacterium]
MTVTRLWQAAAEFNSALVEFTTRSSTSFEASSTVARTGTYSFRTGLNNYATQVLATTYTQLRVSCYVYHAGSESTQSPSLLQIRNGSSVVLDLRWDGANSTLQLYFGTTQIDTVLSAEFAQTSTWLHIGIDIKVDASSGWANVYLDGVEVLSFSGDTTTGSTAMDSLVVGSPRTGQRWNNFLYFDDLYIDNLAGESAVTIVPDYRFVPVTPNGNGNASEWLGSDADSTDNYLLVDEVTPDGDTTYVETDVGNNEDDYTMTNITLEDGYEVSAVIAMAYAKKLNAGGALDLKLATRTEVSGTPYSASSAAFTLGTDYSLHFDRRALRPDGGAWDETTVNALEIGVQAS